MFVRSAALLAVLALVLPSTHAVATAPGETTPVVAFPEVQTWDLSTIYASDDAWHEAKTRLSGRIEALRSWQGRLSESAATLRGALDALYAAQEEFARFSSYATFRADLDTRADDARSLRQEAGLLGTRFGEAVAWMDPELLAIPRETLDRFVAEDPGLAVYRMHLDQVLRLRDHTLSDAEEAVLAATGLLSSTPLNTYRVLSNADLPFPTVELSDETVRLDPSTYTRVRASENRDDRLEVFQEFFSTYKAFEGTLGTNLYGQVKRDIFYSKVRRYDSALDSALHPNGIPTAVYRTLVQQTNDNIGVLHRYLRLRQRLLGVEQLGYHDLYAPVVSNLGASFPIVEAENIIVEALAPLGEGYGEGLARAFGGGWIDAPSRDGKRQGAYSNGSIHALHPFVLISYNDDYLSFTTLAHEMGHAMHSYLANGAQPFANAGYPIFLAEIASTFNEALLNRFMLRRAASDDEKLAILGSYLDNLRGTFFRQTMFAEFELAIHEMVERGEPITGARLSDLYGQLLRRYHGHDEGVCVIDPLYHIEWAYIPHFYYNFYVYQYATGVAAASALAHGVLTGPPEARDSYLAFLSAGGADYPVTLLERAGVDLTQPEPYEAFFAMMNEMMDEIEAILDRRG